jgi:multidrug efflux pump subunit AcrB
VFSSLLSGRSIFALVLLAVILLAVGSAFVALAVRQQLSAPLPTVEVTASYPGANAQVVADTVAAPIEREVAGVMDMVSMSHECTDDGNYRLTITFRRGTDLETAQVLVQNRVALAERMLPDSVKRDGVTVTTPRPR